MTNVKHIHIYPPLRTQISRNLIERNASLRTLYYFQSTPAALTAIGELLNARHAGEQPPTTDDDDERILHLTTYKDSDKDFQIANYPWMRIGEEHLVFSSHVLEPIKFGCLGDNRA